MSKECRTGSNALSKPSTLALVVVALAHWMGALAHRFFLFLDLLGAGSGEEGDSVLAGEGAAC